MKVVKQKTNADIEAKYKELKEQLPYLAYSETGHSKVLNAIYDLQQELKQRGIKYD